jgi:hypothetical protein
MFRFRGRQLHILFFLAILTVMLGTVVKGDDYITLYPTADNYLRSDNKTQNNGTDIALKISQSMLSRDIIRFSQTDIQNATQGKHLITAELKLYITQNYGGWGSSGREVRAFRLTQNWTETGSTWNNATANAAWTTAGGTYADHVSYRQTLSNSSTGWTSWWITDDISDFLSGTYTNYGWLFKKETSSDTGDLDFASKEYSNSARWPKMVLRVRDWNPPTISCNRDRAIPDHNGWYNHDLTVNCTCDDADGDLVFCPTTNPIGSEGYNLPYTFTARDAQGLTASQTLTFSLDKTPPEIIPTYNPQPNAALEQF